ncbi:MAG: ATP-binding cassette domain-containing protein, partial [Oscillospiraceae bacterium]|nr:ATP-binding cassette domain-containing protein [Oscillospiraceae bacterium]
MEVTTEEAPLQQERQPLPSKEVPQGSEKKIPANGAVPAALETYARAQGLWEQALFAVVGDLTLRSRYGESALLFLPGQVLAYDMESRTTPVAFAYDQLHQLKVRRLYGNVLFCAHVEGEKTTLLRFTYAVAEIADAACQFIEAVQKNDYSEKLLGAVHAGFERLESFCPKCGRKLRTLDSPCLNCEGSKNAFSKFFKYVKPQVPALVLCMGASVITTVMDLIPDRITGMMIDTVLPEGVANNTVRKLMQMVLFLLGVKVFQWVVGCFRTYYLRLAGDKITVQLKGDLYAKAQYLPMSFYDKTSTGSVINRINSDTATLQGFLMRVSQEAVTQVFLMVGLVAVMFITNWKLAIFSLTPVPLVVVGSRFFGKKIAPRYRRIWRRGAAISSLLSDTVPAMRVIKAFTNENGAIKKFSRYLDDWLKEDKTVALISSIYNHITGFAVSCGPLIIWALGGSEIISAGNAKGSLTIGALITFISYANKFYGPVNFMAGFSDTYQNTLASVEKILDILDAEPERDFGNGQALEHIQGKIEFRNVNFSFDRSKKVLSNVNVVIEPGDIVGIVGTTGSGKSTLINLLMRYYDDYEGDI